MNRLAPYELKESEVMWGFGWQLYVARFLTQHGIYVVCSAFFMRPENREKLALEGRFANETDITLRGTKRTIEVKGRKLSFTSPTDYPFDDVYVMSAQALRAKKVDRMAGIAMVSSFTGAILWISSSTSGLWYEDSTTDNRRNYSYRIIKAPKRCLVNAPGMIDELRIRDAA